MAIDYGTRRIGIALSDTLRMTAHGFETVSWNGQDLAYALERIAQIVREKEVDEIVVGRPRRTDGAISNSQVLAEEFARQLSDITGIVPGFRDERYTTVIASRYLSDTGVTGRDRKKVVDQVAAEIILREHLESHRKRD